MTALEPADVTKLVADIADLLSRGIRAGGGGSGVKQRRESIDQGYRWVHGQAYGLAAASPPGSTVCRHCHGTRVRVDNGRECEECSQPDHSDRTGEAVLNRTRAAAVAEVACHHLEHARKAVAAARAVLQKHMEGEWDPIPTPRTEPRAGVKEALAAQARRTARGEGMGES